VAPERVHVVPQGVAAHFRPLDPERPAARRAALGLSDRRLVLHVTSGGFYKNIATTLRVVAAVRAAGHDAVLVRAGLGPQADESQLAASLDLDGAFLPLGTVSEDELVELYNAADVLLFPSFYEGFGWPVLEAMACGTPVVASDAAALVELADGAVLHAAPTDVDGLAAAV